MLHTHECCQGTNRQLGMGHAAAVFKSFLHIALQRPKGESVVKWSCVEGRVEAIHWNVGSKSHEVDTERFRDPTDDGFGSPSFLKAKARRCSHTHLHGQAKTGFQLGCL